MNAREIVHALKGRWHGSSGVCRCPAHPDKKPSLSVCDTRDNRVLVHCHAGCEQGAVADALKGLGLWPGNGDRRHNRRPRDQRDDGRHDDAERIRRARYPWRQRKPVESSLAEIYLRVCRGYSGAIPATLGFLPPLKPEHHPALIAACGIAAEPEPGVMAISDDAVNAVHLTLLRPDGSNKASVQPNKIMLGPVSGSPIVLAPMNDLLGLAITEGIEDGLAVHRATGLGVWAAGSASHMPALAAAVPDYVDAITIIADDNAAGLKGAEGLAAGLRERGLHVEPLVLGRFG